MLLYAVRVSQGDLSSLTHFLILLLAIRHNNVYIYLV